MNQETRDRGERGQPESLLRTILRHFADSPFKRLPEERAALIEDAINQDAFQMAFNLLLEAVLDEHRRLTPYVLRLCDDTASMIGASEAWRERIRPAIDAMRQRQIDHDESMGRQERLIEKLIHDLSVKLEESDLTDIRDYTAHNDFDMAFHLLAHLIRTRKLPLTRDDLAKIAATGKELELPASHWDELEGLVASR